MIDWPHDNKYILQGLSISGRWLDSTATQNTYLISSCDNKYHCVNVSPIALQETTNSSWSEEGKLQYCVMVLYSSENDQTWHLIFYLSHSNEIIPHILWLDCLIQLKTHLPNPEKPISWVISVSLGEKPAMGGAWQPPRVWIKLVKGY